ncbi:Ccr4-not transcription complex subunit [Thalictrum thalictroides]|uniref:Ccr4-not transcription complex subunit n=2 Tax=Magnoliopsida TaxID=3398 RepID=A0A7J6V5Z3_THATH|nr:Ccr4-not transcription complex subunit [Thalictrum thalictroides]
MIPLSSTIPNQVRFLIDSLNDSNFDSVFRDLCQFADYGSEGSILVLQTCLGRIAVQSEYVQNMQLKTDFLAAIFRYLLNKPNFSTVLCESLRNKIIGDGFLGDLSKELRLSVYEKISVGLALSDSEDLNAKTSGQNFCMAQIEGLCSNPVPIDSNEQIQNIIIYLSRSGLATLLDSFMQMLSLLQLKHNTSFLLAPLLSDDLQDTRHVDLFYECSENDFDSVLAEIEKEMSMADTMKELGYNCTDNASHCSETLSLFLPLSEATLARLLGTIATTHVGLEDGQNLYATFCAALGSSSSVDAAYSWNVDVLVDSIKQLAPDTNWIRVMENMDHEGFYIPNEEAFSFFMSVYARACKEPFPLHSICGSVWKNTDSQLSFLRYAVSARAEIFTFAHALRQLEYVGSHGQKLVYEPENQSWLSLDLLEVLCHLAERGHASSVRSMLEYPLEHCPEVLLLGMSHINTAFNLLQNEVMSTVLPMIVGNGSKSGLILHLWRANPSLVLRGFLDIHNNNPENLNKILVICQDLKILPSVLEMSHFSFSIKLAALASVKEQFNLEKWLIDNLNTNKDAFFGECLKFLKEIASGTSQDVPASPFQYSGTVANVYSETSSVFFKTLLSQAGQNISRQLFDELKRLHIDDIEAEANSYFHQMFSEQLAVVQMVEMLARFKESPEKREQAVFDCMIANLFEEYKFFPKYPEKQLRIAAVLFGSLIKKQLVTHLTLGIALRGVLDALRKSPDSKMFVFGANALEQFMDRLVEWPQYCNHILQISHLRGTHSGLVAFIEKALARISSGHTESNGAAAAVDHHQASNQATMDNMEVAEPSWKVGSSPSLPGQHLSSPLQMQQRQQGFLDDRLKSAPTSFSYVKPPLSSPGQSAHVSTHDIVGNHKTTATSSTQVVPSQNTSSTSASISTSSGFLRPSRAITASGTHRQHSYNKGFGSALNIETLIAAAEIRDTTIETPASEVQDKISFIFNNLSTTTIEAKAKEFTDILKEEYYPWFAQYIVMKRASIEPNFHDLYLKFLDKLNSKALNKEILKTSYENCKVLLRSDLIKSSSEERSLLKNLGSWLGKFTIGRNQALRAREIDPKVLIIEAYEKGLMIAVIPFTSKVLEPCQSSLAYQPPNPWTMGILGLLTEIYALPNLKMNLKFDIEVLFKNLSVDMKDVKPTSLLKDRLREVEGNPDFSNKDVGASQPQNVSEVHTGAISSSSLVEMQPEVTTQSHPGGHSHILSQYTAPLHLTPALLVDDEKMASLSLSERLPSGQGLPQLTPSQSSLSLSTQIPNIRTQIILNPKLSNIGLSMHFQSVLPSVMERAIKEIMTPVVQRSVTIAMQSTRELVLKDFAMESDESRIYKSAHLMVASLAGSLAHVTCKEPLRVSISNHLRNSLQSLNVANDILEHAVQLVTNDNLDLGCAAVEEAASGKAEQAIDGEIAGQLTIRRKHRDGVGGPYFDVSTYTQGPMDVVPESLRPKPGRLSLSQQRVYEDFARFPWQNQPSQSSSTLPAGSLASSGLSVSSGLSHAYGPTSEQLNSGIYSQAQAGSGFNAVGHPLDLISEEMDSSSAQLLSGSSSHIEPSDAGLQHGSEIGSVTSFPSSGTVPDLHSIEPTTSAKDTEVPTELSPTATERIGSNFSESLLSTGVALESFQVVALKLETVIAKEGRDAEIQGVIAEVPEIILRCVSRDEAALAVAQKVFKRLYENASNSTHVGAHLAILVAIRDVCKLVVKELTSWVIYSDEERKFNKDITYGLIRSELLNLAEYNVHMAKLIDAGRNKAATEFSISLLRTLVQEPGVSASELHNLVDALAKVAIRPGSPEYLQQLVEVARNPAANAAALLGSTMSKEEKASQARDKKARMMIRDDYSSELLAKDSAAFREQVVMLFAQWSQICETPDNNDLACSQFVSRLQQFGLFKGDDMPERFFRVLTEISVSYCISEVSASVALQAPQQHLSFTSVDNYAKLVTLILKIAMLDQGPKLQCLSKILLVTVRVIQKDAEDKKTAFNPRPYFRLFINWLWDLCPSDSNPESVNLQVLTAFANTFLALQPLKVPGFSFAWLELISHRCFMPKLLNGNNQKGWPSFQRLLAALFKFMEPYLRNAALGASVQYLYKGTLRVLLVLLHDFPEFLCNYHFSFCDVIPPSCIQMRNVILSAFPRNMRLPDPSTPNLKIDLLAEITQSPSIFSEVDAALKAKQMKVDIDEYLKTRQQGSPFLVEMKQRLLLSHAEAKQAGTSYNIPLINSLVLYVGMQAIQQLQTKTSPPHPSEMAHTAPMDIFLVGAAMDIFQQLIKDLDTEGRYLFLNAVANQLRYPNNHTHYFSFVLLYLFAEADKETIIQEQITRVLLERLIVNRPHPWGLLITFIELIKNPRYSFWTRPFTHIAPEIEKLFESVSRSCGGPKSMDDSLISGGMPENALVHNDPEGEGISTREIVKETQSQSVPKQPWSDILKKKPFSAGSETLVYAAPIFKEGILQINDDLIKEGEKDWEETVVGFFLDKRLPYSMVKSLVEKKWKLQGQVPKYLWTPNGLASLASAIGKPLVMDKNTESRKMLTYARICIEVEAEKELPSTIPIQVGDKSCIIEVDYTWKPLICTRCKMFGHATAKCGPQPFEKAKPQEKTWVVHKPRWNRGGNAATAQKPGKMKEVWRDTGKGVASSSGVDKNLVVQNRFTPIENIEEEDKLEDLIQANSDTEVTTIMDKGDATGKDEVIEVIEMEEGECSPMEVAEDVNVTSNKRMPKRNNKGGKTNIACQYDDGGLIEDVNKGKANLVGQDTTRITRNTNKSVSFAMDTPKQGRNQLMHVKLTDLVSRTVFLVSVIYARNSRHDRAKLWRDLTDIAANAHEPWIMLGDFNNCRESSDRVGGNKIHPREVKEFNDFIQQNDLAELQKVGDHFTWSNRSAGRGRIMTRIDYCFTNAQWLTHFQQAYIEFHHQGISDHCPMILQWGKPISKVKGTFRFYNHWTQHSDFMAIVEKVWQVSLLGNPMMQLTDKLKLLKRELKGWSKSNFSNLTERVKIAKNDLDRIQEEIQRRPLDPHLASLEKEAIRASKKHYTQPDG